MLIHRHVLNFLSLVLIFSCHATSAPTNTTPFNLPTIHINFPVQDLQLPRLPYDVNATSRPTSPSLGNTSELSYFVNWPISDTLSLRVEVGEWRLSAARIVQILNEVQDTVGKKVSSARLTEKYVVSTGRYLNTMVFEITPALIDDGIKWADVTEIVGPHGLPSFFQNTEEWRSTYFEIFRKDGNRYVDIGNGAIRKKWYQRGLPIGRIDKGIGGKKRKLDDDGVDSAHERRREIAMVPATGSK